MSVQSESFEVSYTGNNSSVVAYVVPFKFFKSAHLKVAVLDGDGAETILALNTDYTVSGEGDEEGGEILTVAAWDNTNTITIKRVMPVVQPFAFEEGGALPMSTLEDAYDWIVMMMQQLSGSAGEGKTALRFPFAEPDSFSTELPVPVSRKDSLIYFDPDTGEMSLISKTALAALLAPLITGVDTSLFPTKAGDNTFTGANTFNAAVTLAAALTAAAATFSGTLTANGKALFAKQVEHEPLALTDGATITWDASLGNIATVTLGGNRTLANLTNLTAGKAATFTVKVTQDGTGSRTLAYGNAFKFPGGTAPVLSTAAGAVDILTFVTFSGTNLYLVAQKAFA